MSNMSYCRFQNTDSDLRDCQQALEQLLIGQEEPLSDEELEAAKRLVARCAAITNLIATTAGINNGEFTDTPIGIVNDVLDTANDEAEELRA